MPLLWFLLFLTLLVVACYLIWAATISIFSITFGQLIVYLLLLGAGYALGVSRKAGGW